MATRLEKLMFRIGVKDDASDPVGKLQKALRSTSRMSKQAWGQLAGGAMTAAGAGLALEGMVSPALDLNRALADVSSLDVDAKGLKLLDATAKQYAMSYGGTAAEFVASSYAIQSGIAGLDASQLADFTRASNVLAKATKADAATMTNYAGTMYGIFKQQADAQGKSSWIEDVAGKSAYAIQIFKTSGTEMSAAFTALGANATSSGIKLEEQMAILGKLQATMSGSEAGTKYKAFLAGVGQAQKELGLKFTDGQGRMLPVLQILDKLKKKYGALDVLADSDLIKKAFGSDEAVSMLKLLIQDTGGLADNIKALEDIKGMGKAEAMARKMVDPFHKLNAALNTVSAAWWQKLLPPVNDAVEVFNRFMGKVLWFIDTFPNITRQLGYAVLAFSGLAIVGGAWNVVMGLSKLGILGLFNPIKKLVNLFKKTGGIILKLKGPLMAIGGWAKGGLGTLLNLFGKLFGPAGRLAFLFAQLRLRLSLVASLIMQKGAVAFTKLGSLLLTAARGFWAMSAALLANPVFWIVAGVIVLIAAVAGLIIYWDELKAAFGDTWWGQAIIQIVQDICNWWDRLTKAFSSGSWSGVFIELINAVTAPLRKFLELVGWALEKVGLIDSDSSFYAMTKPLDEKTFETVGKLAGGTDYLSGMPGTYVPVGAGYAAAVHPEATPPGGSLFRFQTPDYTAGMPGTYASTVGQASPERAGIPALNAPRTLDVPRGGLMSAVTNATTNNTQNKNRSITIGTANFTLTDGKTVEDIAEEFGLAMP